jgi:4-amino-4-deoxy-L-arabinose transferase-like glycosyltransferase
VLGTFLLTVILVTVGLTIWSAPDFRGSDQHWHNENVRTLMRGASAETHEVYPFSLIGTDTRFDERRPFIHNAPVVYVWGAVGRLLGDAHAAILVVNIVCALAAAAFVYSAARRFMSRLGALAAAAILLTVPVNVWITGQNMLEPLSAALVALALLLVVRNPRSIGAFVAAQGAIALAAAGRIWTVPFLLLVPLGLVLVDDGRPFGRRLLRGGAVLAAGVALYLPLSSLFVSYMPELNPMAVLEVSRNNNMVLFFATEPPDPLNAGVFLREMLANFRVALRSQVAWGPQWYTISSSFPAADLIPVIALAVIAASGLIVNRHDRSRLFIALLALGALAMHLGMSTLYQTLPRYAVPVLPVLVLGAAVACDSWTRRVRPSSAPSSVDAATSVSRRATAALITTALLLFTVINVANADATRHSALLSRQYRAGTAALIEPVIPDNARVVLDTPFGRRWVWDHALYPRPLLALGTEFPFEPEQYRRMADAFQPDYIVVSGDSLLPGVFDLRRVAGDESVTVYEYLGPGDLDVLDDAER